MGTPISLNGVTYTIPAVGEDNWGTDVGNYLVALATGVLTKTGGAFTLTADADFGPNFGLKAAYLKSRGTAAAAGVVRLANLETVSWRNAANSSDLALRVNGSDWLQFNGVDLVDKSTAQTITNKAIDADANTISNIEDGDIKTGAGIARSKLAAGTASHVVINDGSGNFSSEANLDITRGGTGAASANAARTALGLAIGTDVQAYSAKLANFAALTDGAAGKVLSTLGSGSGYAWADALVDPLTTRGDILFRNSSNVTSRLAIGSANRVLRSDGADPSWGQLVNADVSSSAAIAYSKLNLATSIVNGDVSGSAAIAYSKLNLGTSIVNTDFASGAEVSQSARGVVKSAGQLLAVSSTTAAGTGYVGELASRTRVRSSAAGLVSATSKNVTSSAFALDPGDWLLTGWVGFDAGSATGVTVFAGGISTSAGAGTDTLSGTDTLAVPTSGEVRVQHRQASASPGGDVTLQIPGYRVSLSATTTFYLVGLCTFSGGTCSVYGRIEAWRVR